jgi:DUF438 domain-containing protein
MTSVTVVKSITFNIESHGITFDPKKLENDDDYLYDIREQIKKKAQELLSNEPDVTIHDSDESLLTE